MHILYICNGNVARSQEAEAYTKVLKLDIRASSAGVDVRVGKPIHPLVIEVMAEEGISLEGAYRKVVDQNMVDAADVIVSFKPYDELPEFVQRRTDIRFWDIPDPRHQDIAFHRMVRDSVKLQVHELLSTADKSAKSV